MAVIISKILYVIGSLVSLYKCPIRALTGISCAGCGMTRAWMSFFQGDVVSAVHFHPLFWLTVPAMAVFLFRERLTDKAYHYAGYGIAVIFIVTYLARMFNPQDTIVSFQPDRGLIYHALFRIYRTIGSNHV